MFSSFFLFFDFMLFIFGLTGPFLTGLFEKMDNNVCVFAAS